MFLLGPAATHTPQSVFILIMGKFDRPQVMLVRFTLFDRQMLYLTHCQRMWNYNPSIAEKSPCFCLTHGEIT
jgi:hypothetical protein